MCTYHYEANRGLYTDDILRGTLQKKKKMCVPMHVNPSHSYN